MVAEPAGSEPAAVPTRATTAAAGDLDGLREIGELLLLAAEQVGAVVERAAVPERLTATEARALRYLCESAMQRDLAVRLGCDSSRVTAIIDRLVSRGYVRRKVSPHDRRYRIATVTPEGHAAVARIGERLATTSPLIGRLSPEERDVLAVALRRLTDPG
ncbi:MAG: MarR family transcriptional regulator [Actinomycetota bacterium]|nr:MarR family transcriptional regulator [Actinomycetota bacterium]